MAVIKDVAEHAGLSVSVISKYLKNPDSVRDDTREKIEGAIKALNYRPSTAARALRIGHTGMLSVVSPNITNPFFAELFHILQSAAAKRGYTLILQTIASLTDSDSVVSRQFAVSSVNRVDGTIVCFPDDEKVVDHLERRSFNTPMVLLTGSAQTMERPTINLDVEEGIYQATRYLINMGHQHIYYIGAPESSGTSQMKHNGFLKALAEFRLKPQPKHIHRGLYSIDTGYEATRQFFKEDVPPTAIVTEADIFALGCLKACRQMDLHVPQQVAITGFDDIMMSSVCDPPLTTLRVPLQEMGEAAVEMLCALVEKPDVPAAHSYMHYKTQLVVRKTTEAGYTDSI